MRVVLQRVSSASVWVDDREVSAIGRGVVALVGLHRDDTRDDVEYCVRKILRLKLFPNAEGKWWKSNVMDIGGEVLMVSQFTLFALFDGNKIDFHRAMSAVQAEETCVGRKPKPTPL